MELSDLCCDSVNNKNGVFEFTTNARFLTRVQMINLRDMYHLKYT